MDDTNNKKKEFTSQEIKLPKKQRQAFVNRLKRRNLGEYKMGTYKSIRDDKFITSIAALLHFNIDKCLTHDTLRDSDKEFIRSLK